MQNIPLLKWRVSYKKLAKCFNDIKRLSNNADNNTETDNQLIEKDENSTCVNCHFENLH